MSWARIMAPLSGGAGDAEAAAAAVLLAEPFQAEMVGVYTPADVADVMPWMGEGFLGGVDPRLHHGTLNAVFLPAVIRFNAGAESMRRDDRLNRMAHAQWHHEEIASGEPFARILNNQGLKC